MNMCVKRIFSIILAMFYGIWFAPMAQAYSFDMIVPDVRQPLTRTATQNACGSDGANSICFDQADMAFTPGVLAFTRMITTDRLGVQVGSSAVATQFGQILDADIYFNPS